MNAILKIATRNLVQHRGKSLIVGILITLGIALTYWGNALFETAALGVKRSYAENFTGDVMIQAQSDKKFSLFGSEDFNFSLASEPVPTLPHYDRVLEFLSSNASVAAYTSEISGQAMINLDPHGQTFSLLFGVEPQSYFQTFPNIRVIDGRMLQSGESGILMSRKRLAEIEKSNKVSLKVGDEILLTSYTALGLKIRSVPLVGVYEYTIPTQALDVVSFLDAQTLRALNAMTVGTKDEVKLSDSTQSLLDLGDEDFFSDTAAVPEVSSTTNNAWKEELAHTEVRDQLQTLATGSWHNVLVRLNPGSNVDAILRSWNAEFQKENLGIQAVGWKLAAGTTASLTDVAQTIFNVVVVILAVVAVIIIINTLIISVMERTAEIGTMRALGAQKPFIRRMFVAETLVLAGVFGVLGMILGVLGVWGLRELALPIDNDFLQVLFGATQLKPDFHWTQVGQAAAYTLFIGMVSWIYPVSIALKVSPLKAISTE